MIDRPVRTAAVCGTAAAVARAVHAGLRRRRRPGWERVNHAGRAVGLYAGPAVAAGTALAALGAVPPRERAAAVQAVLAGALCGAYDDLRGDHRRGLRAHLGALRHGEVTSGAVKLFGIGAAGLAAGVLLKERPLDRLLTGVVVTGAAHFVNLLDVRPGRAASAVLVLGVPGVVRGGPLAAAPAGPPRRSSATTCGSARCSATPGRTRWARPSAWPSPPGTGGSGWPCTPPRSPPPPSPGRASADSRAHPCE